MMLGFLLDEVGSFKEFCFLCLLPLRSGNSGATVDTSGCSVAFSSGGKGAAEI